MSASETEVRTSFAKQAEWCRKLNSPFMSMLCETLPKALDRQTATGAQVLDWPGEPMADALPLRLAGGLHALVRCGRLPELATLYPPNPARDADRLAATLRDAIHDTDTELRPWLDSAPQTNEVGRSGALMPGLLVIAAETGLPLDLFELGASAGLNLRLDSYAYRLGELQIAPAGAPIELAPTWEGVSPPDARLRIAGRRGVDLNPIDVTDPAMRERLLAYVWPDQTARLNRLQRALDAAAADPPPLDAEAGAAWVGRHPAPRAGVARVLVHSIALQYFPPEGRDRIAAHMERAGAKATTEAPLAWLHYEFEAAGDAPTLRLRLWPGGEDRLLAYVHPHGAWVRWQGQDLAL